MRKNIKKNIVVLMMVLALGGGTAASAANKFKFSIVTSVIGKTEFKLQAKKTTCVSTAATYRYNTDNLVDFVGRYAVDLDGNGFFNKDYEGTYKRADGNKHTTNYGKIDKNTYTVTVGVNIEDNIGPMGGQIKGEGELKQ